MNGPGNIEAERAEHGCSLNSIKLSFNGLAVRLYAADGNYSRLPI